MIKISITDWQKFNPRTDSKNHTWFRFENTFFTKAYSLTAEEQRLFIYLCCVFSQEKKDEVILDMELACALLKRKPQQIKSNLDALEQRKLITQSNLKLLEVTQSSLVPTNERTNDTNERTIDHFDFDKVYDNYPRKIGRKKGIEACKAQIKTQEDYDKLLSAIQAYASHCQKNRVEEKFIKHFSTFMSTWTDWTLPNSGKLEMPKPKPTPMPVQEQRDMPVQDPKKAEEISAMLRAAAKRIF